MMISGFECYQLSTAVKLHFGGAYDFFKYHGRVNISKDKYPTMPDAFRYEKLAKAYDGESLKDLFVSNYSEKPKIWIGEVQEHKMRFWQKYFENFEYNFSQISSDVFSKFKNKTDCEEFFFCKYAVNFMDIPVLKKLFLDGGLDINDFLAFDVAFNIIDPMNVRFESDEFIWGKYYRQWNKLKPFFKERLNMNTTLKIITPLYRSLAI